MLIQIMLMWIVTGPLALQPSEEGRIQGIEERPLGARAFRHLRRLRTEAPLGLRPTPRQYLEKVSSHRF